MVISLRLKQNSTFRTIFSKASLSGGLFYTGMAHLSTPLYFSISNRSSGSQVYNLTFASLRIPVFCHMEDFGCGDGGWTPIMKIDGNKAWLLSLIDRFFIFSFSFFV